MIRKKLHRNQQACSSGISESACILIFPPPQDRSSVDLELIKSLGVRALMASSEAWEGIAEHESDFIQLPFITEKHFLDHFCEVILKERITHFYSDNEGVWNYVNGLKDSERRLKSLNILGESPFKRNWSRFKESFLWGFNLSEKMETDDNKYKRRKLRKLTALECASLHFYYGLIPGQSDVTKLELLIEIFSDLPKGDIVEIGSLYGRSGFAMARLSEIFENGTVFCIDPWDINKLEPQGTGSEILAEQLAKMSVVDTDQIHNVFLTATSILDNITYIRNTSEEASRIYAQAVNSGYYKSSIGKDYSVCGQIALLHIDGNHHYEHVRKDVELWSPRIASGGFLVLDDYCWSYGDGPRRVGDALMATGLYRESFVVGGSLYLKK